jgi:hypothetical protein
MVNCSCAYNAKNLSQEFMAEIYGKLPDEQFMAAIHGKLLKFMACHWSQLFDIGIIDLTLFALKVDFNRCLWTNFS